MTQAPPDQPSAATAVPAPTAALPRWYLPALTSSHFSLFLAFLTPVLVAMAFKIQHITEASGGNRDAALGLVLGVGAFFSTVSNPLAGRLSDRTMSRFGMRRPWMAVGAVGGCLAMTLIAVAQTVWLVLVGWCLAQVLLNTFMAAATATVPDQVPEPRRGTVSGAMGMAVPLAAFAAVLLCNAFASDLVRFVVPGLFILVFGLLFAFVLRDRRLHEKPEAGFGLRQFLGSFVFDPRANPDFGWTWITKFLVMFGYLGVSTFLPYFLTDRFDMSEQQVTGMLVAASLVSAVAMVGSSLVSGLVSDRVGRRRIFVTAGGLVMVAGLLLTAFAPSTSVVVVAQGLIGLGAGCFLAVDAALATQVLPSDRDTAKDLGVLNIANALPQSLAPAIAPGIIALGSATGIGGYTAWFLFGAVAALLGAVLVYRIKGVR